MDNKQKLILSLLGVAVLVGLCTFAFWPHAPAKTAGAGPSSTASATIAPGTPQATGTPAPTTPPAVDGATIGGPGPSEDEGYNGPVADLSQHYKTADAAMLAYATVTPGESVDARAARLAQFFPAGSPYLTGTPQIANPHQYTGIEATVAPTSTAVAGFEAESTDSYSIMVVFDYHGLYVQSGQPKEVFGTGTWHVAMSKTFDGKILSVIEPNNLG